MSKSYIYCFIFVFFLKKIINIKLISWGGGLESGVARLKRYRRRVYFFDFDSCLFVCLFVKLSRVASRRASIQSRSDDVQSGANVPNAVRAAKNERRRNTVKTKWKFAVVRSYCTHGKKRKERNLFQIVAAVIVVVVHHVVVVVLVRWPSRRIVWRTIHRQPVLFKKKKSEKKTTCVLCLFVF